MAAITGRHAFPFATMSNLPPDPRIRVYFNPPPVFRTFGCMGCLIAVFVVGGIIGVLLFGWKTLLGM